MTFKGEEMSVDFKELTRWLEHHEGIKLRPYYCTAGKLTIGVGRNLEDVGISRSEAQFMLENDIIRVMKQMDESIPFWRDLDEVRQLVLLDMAFNLGVFGLTKFQNTLALIEAEEFEAASEEMLRSRWAEQVGQRAQNLSEAMRTGAAPF